MAGVGLQSTGVGFFGKVTSHGDFVARRLPSDFIQVWDGWLQAALQASRSDLGTGWLATYLSSPLWRFVLAPGVCGPRAWAGVLMPSVDRVGRHFPLTVVSPVSNQSLLEWVAQSGPWYEHLETLALSSLQEGFSLDDFDAQLLAIEVPVPGGDGGKPMTHGRVTPMAGLAQLDTVLPALTRRLADAGLLGQSLWWSEGSDLVMPSLMQCQGLPPTAGFSALLEGRWSVHGWQLEGA